MDNATATNYCAHCFDFFDEATLTSVTFNNRITVPIKFRFCKACFARMNAGDEELKNTMWERYHKLLPYEEKRQKERLYRQFNVTVQ